jgi:DNA-binding response OmpR family regulator
MDVMMPDKDGWDTIREIREFSKIPLNIYYLKKHCLSNFSD